MHTFIMIEEESEEIEAETGDRDALFKSVFDNIRNIIVCAALAIAGAGVIKWRADLHFFGPIINATIGILLIFIAFLLHMEHGSQLPSNLDARQRHNKRRVIYTWVPCLWLPDICAALNMDDGSSKAIAYRCF